MSALREIKGVGEKTEQRLILHYGSVARIAAATEDDLASLVGRDLAQRIRSYLNPPEPGLSDDVPTFLKQQQP